MKISTLVLAAFLAAGISACGNGSGGSLPPDGGGDDTSSDDTDDDADDDIGNADDDVSDDDDDDTMPNDDDDDVTDDTDVDDDVADDDAMVDDDVEPDMDASMPEPDVDDTDDDDVTDDDTNGGTGGELATGGTGGDPSVAGSGGTPASGGSGGELATGGAGGNTSVGGSGGTGGDPSVAGSGGTPASGGSGGDPSVGGTGGTPASGGVGGNPPIGGNGGTPPSGCPGGCNDGNACTFDVCVGTTCTFTAMNCNDSNACNGVETCNPATGCTNPPDVDCDDGVPCTVDSCSPATGACSNTPNSNACDDGVSCTIDSCNATTGCESTPDDGLCGGNQECNENTGCENIPVTWETIGMPQVQDPIPYLQGAPDIQGFVRGSVQTGAGGSVSLSLVQPQGAPPPPGGSGGEGGTGGAGGSGAVDAGPPITGTLVVSARGCSYRLPDLELEDPNEGDIFFMPAKGEQTPVFGPPNPDPCVPDSSSDVQMIDPPRVYRVENGVPEVLLEMTEEDRGFFLGAELLSGEHTNYVLSGNAPIGQRIVSRVRHASVGMALCPNGQLFLASNASPRVIQVGPDGTRTNHDVPGAGPGDDLYVVAQNMLSGGIMCDVNDRVFVTTSLVVTAESRNNAIEADPDDPSLLVEVVPLRVLELDPSDSTRTEILSVPLSDAVVAIGSGLGIDQADPDPDLFVVTSYRDVLKADQNGRLNVGLHHDARVLRVDQENVGAPELVSDEREVFTDIAFDPEGGLWYILNATLDGETATPPRVAYRSPAGVYDNNIVTLTDYTPEFLVELGNSSPLESGADGLIVLGSGVFNSIAINPNAPEIILTLSALERGVRFPIQ